MAGANLKLVAMDGRAVRDVVARPMKFSRFDWVVTITLCFLAAWMIGGITAILFGIMWVLKIAISSFTNFIGLAVV